MRSSSRKDDIGWANFQPGTEILLDGQPVTKVITADEELRALLRFQTGPDGQPVLSDDKQTLLTEILYGKVEIIQPKPGAKNPLYRAEAHTLPDIPAIRSIERVTLAPGEKLLVTYEQCIPLSQIERMQKLLTQQLGCPVTVTDGNPKLSIIQPDHT